MAVRCNLVSQFANLRMADSLDKHKLLPQDEMCSLDVKGLDLNAGRSRMKLWSLTHSKQLDTPQASASIGGTYDIGTKQQSKSGRRLRESSSSATSVTSHRKTHSKAAAPIDAWLHEAIYEIVSHLKDAPFLHLVFHGERSVRHTIADEAFEDPSCWDMVKNDVFHGQPDGFILVQRLDEESEAKCYGSEYFGISGDSSEVSSDDPNTAVWGLVIQGKGNKRHGCYILKTTRVNSIAGACTRFSLTRAKCFGPALHRQLENSWLVQNL